jgi:hypothetical protein
LRNWEFGNLANWDCRKFGAARIIGVGLELSFPKILKFSQKYGSKIERTWGKFLENFIYPA